jgi:hypothetical protein
MAAQKQEEQTRAERDKKVHQQLDLIIGEQVLHQLGQPTGLHSVQVRKVWDDHYRVNVFVGVGVDTGCAKVAHSYFLVTDGAGNIVASTPKLTRQY